MFKYVLIDIDNTLLDFNKCAEKAMTNACKACGVGFKKEMPSVFHKSTTLSGKDSKREKSQGIKYTKNGGIWFFRLWVSLLTDANLKKNS